jgi:hypothetical protein
VPIKAPLGKKGLLDAKVQIISGHQDRKSLADVDQEYQDAMRDFPVK